MGPDTRMFQSIALTGPAFGDRIGAKASKVAVDDYDKKTVEKPCNFAA